MAGSSVKKSSTVFKALNVLEAVGESRSAVSLSDIASEVGLDRSTAYRLLTTLEEAGYVVRSGETKKYRLSYKVITLGRNLLSGDKKLDLIRETLRGLSERTRETANFAALDGFQMVLVMQSKGSQILSVDFNVGDRSDLYCTAIGKAVLAFQDDGFIDEVLAREMPKVARNTITDPDRLRAEVRQIRINGFATDYGEFTDELRCVAAPVFESGGKVLGGINFSGPRQRYSDAKLAELTSDLVGATRELSQKLGGMAWMAR